MSELRALVDFELQSRVVPESGPGVPFAALAAKNDELLKNNYELVASACVEFVFLLCVISPDEYASYTAEELLRLGINFPARVFVKNELHKLAKLLEKRYRLIWSVSLILQVAQRVCDGPQNQVEIDNWRYCPSMPGQNKSSEVETLQFFQSVSEAMPFRVDTDMNGWDVSVSEWELWADAYMRLKLYRAVPGTMIFNLVLNSARAHMNQCVSLSDGTLYAQLNPGIMKSGSFNTGPTNSRIRVLCALFVQYDLRKIAMESPDREMYLPGIVSAHPIQSLNRGLRTHVRAYGDDCVERVPFWATADMIRHAYAKLGHNCKDINFSVADEPFEFCSTRFGPYAAAPLGWRKSLFNFLQGESLDGELRKQQFAQLLYDFRHGGELPDSCTQAELCGIITTVYGLLARVRRFSPANIAFEAAGDISNQIAVGDVTGIDVRLTPDSDLQHLPPEKVLKYVAATVRASGEWETVRMARATQFSYQ